MANNPINAIDPDGAKIVFLNSTKATNLEQRIQYLQTNNKAFNTLFTTIRDDPSYTYYVGIDNEELDRRNANGAASSVTNQIFFRDNIGDATYLSDKAVVEEFFHVLQHQTYDGKRESQELEAEAKLFDYVVLGQLGLGYEKAPLPIFESQLHIDPNLSELYNKPNPRIEGDNLIKSYFEHLKNFENNTRGDPFYGGSQRQLLPEVYNHIFNFNLSNNDE